MIYSADFETTTNKDDCRVWAWALCEVGNVDNFRYGNCIDSLFEWMQKQDSLTLYFHNLKFDGEFILYWLFHHNFAFVRNRKELVDRSFTTLIGDMGQFYSITIIFDKKNKKRVTIYDSLKILPMSVDQMAKAFGLPINKLHIDYDEKREIGHELTQEEIDYIKNDVSIVAMAIDHLFSENLKKMTTGSNAMADYKKIIGKKNFERWFPPPSYDKDLRQSYKGGFTYLNPKFAGLDIPEGIVLDVNSLYPSVMYDRPLPYGEGMFYNGEYEQDDYFNLYVQMFRCSFEVKKNHIPTIQLKNNLSFVPTEYVRSSKGEVITLCLTSVDLKLFFQHYNVENVEYLCGWKFRSTGTLFKEYIDKWNGVKVKATEEGNKGLRQIAKLMLNSLYGKFATNPIRRSKFPYLGEDDVIHYELGPEEEGKPVYLPVGVFITAWARFKTITSAQKVYDRFVYADTDSLHLIGTDIPQELEIHPTKLGAWKHESTFSRARFLRQKTYIEEIDGELKITCAGMPASCYPYVTWENFHDGMSYPGKLKQAHTKGGVVLIESPHTLK